MDLRFLDDEKTYRVKRRKPQKEVSNLNKDGEWTRRQLRRMDDNFCARMREVHGDR